MLECCFIFPVLPTGVRASGKFQVHNDIHPEPCDIVLTVSVLGFLLGIFCLFVCCLGPAQKTLSGDSRRIASLIFGTTLPGLCECIYEYLSGT